MLLLQPLPTEYFRVRLQHGCFFLKRTLDVCPSGSTDNSNTSCSGHTVVWQQLLNKHVQGILCRDYFRYTVKFLKKPKSYCTFRLLNMNMGLKKISVSGIHNKACIHFTCDLFQCGFFIHHNIQKKQIAEPSYKWIFHSSQCVGNITQLCTQNLSDTFSR